MDELEKQEEIAEEVEQVIETEKFKKTTNLNT